MTVSLLALCRFIRNGMIQRINTNEGLPPNHKVSPNSNIRNSALRQKQRKFLTPSASNRHEIIRNWESYKVRRQHQRPNPQDNRRIAYENVDITSEGQVLPPIRRNERIEIPNRDMKPHPQGTIPYYPIDSGEDTSYYPEQFEDEPVGSTTEGEHSQRLTINETKIQLRRNQERQFAQVRLTKIFRGDQ